MKYNINSYSRLIIKPKVLGKLKEHKQKIRMLENGGILFGKVKKDYSQFIITDITTPCKKDERGYTYFVRNNIEAQKVIDKKWRESEGIINYLGEWHTHPVKSPTPSYIDQTLIDNCFKYNSLNFNILFLIIIGLAGNMYVGYQKRNMDKLIKLDNKY